jgi:Leucine-rich repeat (LRR) protein
MHEKPRDTDIPVCDAGTYCLKLRDKEHFFNFIHLKPRNFEQSITQCAIAKNPELTLEENLNPISDEIPKSLLTLTEIHTVKMIGRNHNVNINMLTSLQNHIQTFIATCVYLTPNLKEESNAIYTLTKLRYLEFRNCQISELNNNISKLTALQTFLIKGDADMITLPQSVTILTSLQELELNNKQIQIDTMKSVICKIPSLQVLNLDLTRHLEMIPSEISQLTSLQHLSLWWSEVTSLATHIGLLTRLHILDLEYCDSLYDIPSELEHLHNLTEFRIQAKNMKTFPFTMKKWTELQTLEVNELSIEMFPSEIWLLTKLKHLSLRHSKLTSVPSVIRYLSNLTHLNLNYSHITHISHQISQLTRLQSLYLSSNQLTEIPGIISSFIHLTELQFDGNKLNEFPRQLPYSLNWLSLEHNSITSIPSKIFYSLSSLKKLYLLSNQITVIPTEIAFCTSIESLHMEANKLLFIPSDLNMNSKLMHIWVSSNNLSLIPPPQPLALQSLYISYTQNPLKLPPNAINSSEWCEFFEVHNDIYMGPE